MSNSLIQYAYVAGEASPTIYGRSDLEKYDLSLALCRDWFVDYRGGISTRPGSEFREWLQHPDKPIRWFPFEFSPNVANTNIVIFGHNYIRFLQEGRYVLEDAKTVTGISGEVVTSAGHGFTSGDLGRFLTLSGPDDLLGRLFEIIVLSSDTFSLRDQFGEVISAAGLPAFSFGTFAKAFTIASPYAVEDLAELNSEQIRDTLRLSHYKYKTRDLTRTGESSWLISLSVFSSQVQRPTNLAGQPSSPGTAGVCYAVTAVDHNGAESLPSVTLVEKATVNFTTTAGSYTLFWTPVPGAKYYNVYRSTVSNESGNVSRAMQLGFAGRAYGGIFVDNNVIPNFSRLPPEHNNPFADRSIRWVDVVAGGTGYNQDSVLTVSDPNGSGFIGYAVVSGSGIVVGVVINNGGEGYTSPTITLSGGSGAVFSAEIGPQAQNYPSVSAVFQQRQVYAGTLEAPLGIWGSKPKRFNNFDVSPIIVDNDSYDFEIDASKVSMIRHLIPMRGGLLAMNDIGVWQLTGGNQIAVTPTNALAEPQSYTGISNLTPIKIETDLVYVESKGYTVRLLSYNDLAKLYAGSDISILSAHFFGKGKEILSWTFAQEPYKLLHAIREDGYRLLGTIVKEQNLFAWTLTSTRGWYKQVITIREDRLDRVYLDVARVIKGKLVRYIELEAEREFRNIEDAWALDSALALEPTYPTATLTPAAVLGEDISFKSDVAIFSNADVGKIIFCGGGKARVTAFISSTEVTCTILREIRDLYPQSTLPAPCTAGTWTLDAPVTSVAGLWHLEGQTVSILADGNVMPPRTVVNGRITFDAPVVRAIIGLSYRPLARTLPPTAQGMTIEDKRKRVVAMATRINNSRGLKAGTSLTSLYEFKDRTTENYGEPIQARDDMVFQNVEPEWDINGQVYYAVDDPLPVTILGHVSNLEVGDDQN